MRFSLSFLDPDVTGRDVPSNLHDPAVYNFATLYIRNMGDDMGTDPADGNTAKHKPSTTHDRQQVSFLVESKNIQLAP